MSMWPRAVIRTYSKGLPLIAEDLNRFQLAVVHKSHGDVTEPLPVSGRLITSGTWGIDTTAGTPGSIAESVNARACQIVPRPPPVGSVITGMAMKVKDGGGTSLVRMEAFLRSFSESAATVVGSVDTTGTGAVQIVPLTMTSPFQFTIVQGDRLYVTLSTQGGGAAERRVYEIYVTYFRP
jgi:hypothetical protein